MSVAALVIWPAPETSTVDSGKPRFVWLKALKFSHRNSRLLVSPNMKLFESDRLKRYCAGPRSEPFDAVPFRYGCCGGVYAAGLNQRSRLGLGTLGSPT